MSPAERISIEREFELYLARVEFKKEGANPILYSEMKRAFFGAYGQCLILLRDRIAVLDADVGIKFLEQLLREVGVFFSNEITKQFPNEREKT